MNYLFGLVISLVIAFFVFGSITEKAGYPRWYCLLMAIPLVNLVVIGLFAYSTWPIESEVLELRFGRSMGAGATDKT